MSKKSDKPSNVLMEKSSTAKAFLPYSLQPLPSQLQIPNSHIYSLQKLWRVLVRLRGSSSEKVLYKHRSHVFWVSEDILCYSRRREL